MCHNYSNLEGVIIDVVTIGEHPMNRFANPIRV
jgi:hypothetical protein